MEHSCALPEPALVEPDVESTRQPSAAEVLRVLVVEDEPLARERLQRLLGAMADCEVVATCHDGEAALRLLARSDVDIDVAVLDVGLPGPDGLAVAARAAARGAACIFTTANSEHAVEAFAIEAVDFLVKPFSRERLALAMRRVAGRIVARRAVTLAQRMRSLLDPTLPSPMPAAVADAAREAAPGRGRFLVRHDGRMTLVRETQIEWIEADGKACLLHLGGKVLRAAESFSTVLGNVSQERFLQVNRSAAINTDRIREIHELFKGQVSILMACGTEISVSRRFRTRALAQLGASV